MSLLDYLFVLVHISYWYLTSHQKREVKGKLLSLTVSSTTKAIVRPLKKVLFDTTGFLGAKKLTQEQRDSRQNLYDNRSKEQCFEAICEHITAV